MSAEKELNTDTPDEDTLLKPTVEFHSLLKHAGARKEFFTMKEVKFYLGQYILQKQLDDQEQHHIVHCAQDELGRLMGVDSFSVKEPRVIHTMLLNNLVVVKSREKPNLDEVQSNGEPERTTEAEVESQSLSLDRMIMRRRSHLSSEPGTSRTAETNEREVESAKEEDKGKSDSDASTLEHSSRSSDSNSTVTTAAVDSDSDQFSVEFEVESTDSDDYNDEDSTLSAEESIRCASSQENLWTDCESSSSDSQEPLLSATPPSAGVSKLEHNTSAEGLPKSCLDPCVICQSRPKNGCIVHGKTGHIVSCYVCARKLKKRNKLCPVCRSPIQYVTLTFFN